MGHIINIAYGGNTILNRSEGYNRYISSIRGYQLLPQEEEEKLLREYVASKDEKRKIEIRNILLQANQRFVIAAARQYANGDTDMFLDMISEATLGFIEAIETYDFAKVQKGKKLFSWAAWFIRRACNNYLINYRSMIKQSNSQITYHKLANTRSLLLQKFGREATDDEIVEQLAKEGLPIKDVRDVRKMAVSSIDIDTSDEDGFNHALADFNNATANNNDCERESERNYASLVISHALDTLSERDREIIKMLYGLNDQAIEYSTEAVADRFNFTTERIRQIHISALKKMSTKIKVIARHA